jgi:hypothetical protein
MQTQNVAFVGTSLADESDEGVPGRGLALALRERLATTDWSVEEPDLWRGSGWSMTCRFQGEELDLALAAGAESEWTMQIAASQSPGWIGRLRGKPASASPESCYALARAVHAALVSLGTCSSVRWCWDADPWSSETTAEPSPPRARATG